METEEQNLHPSEVYVPEEARVTILGVKITLEEHMAEVRYRQGSGAGGSTQSIYDTSSDREGEERQAVVRW